jgi:hypothetical protein
MNKHKILVAILGAAAIAFASCKKTDVQHDAIQKSNLTPSVTAQWKSLNNWSSQSEEKYTVYSNAVTDTNITSSIASKGLVLAYKKTSSSIVALPSNEKESNSSYFWYYQISDGNIVFSADAYGQAEKPGVNQAFAYFVISPEKLQVLEAKGYSKAQLMKLSYENAAALLK